MNLTKLLVLACTACIFLADVLGHGVPAALVASMVKVSVFASAENQKGPANIIGDLKCNSVQRSLWSIASTGPTSQVSVDFVSCAHTRFAMDRRLDVGIRVIPSFAFGR
jgi:hypothetical protein